MARRNTRRASFDREPHAISKAVKEVHAIRREIRLRREREGLSLKRGGGGSSHAPPSERRLRQKYIQILEKGETRDIQNKSVSKRVEDLRKLVIMKGLPHKAGSEGNKQCSLRGLVWKILLGAVHMDTSLYIRLVECGPSDQDAAIQQDLFRVFPNDPQFVRQVPLDQMSRVLNALFHLHAEEEEGAAGAAPARPGGGGGGGGGATTPGGEPRLTAYHQVMSILAGVLLFEMPEPDAFFCLNAVLVRQIPRYVCRGIPGVHAACRLVERALAEADPQLADFLRAKCLTGQIFAFPYLLSLYTCSPPLDEVIKMMDVMFAFGTHLVVLLVVAQCILLRDRLLNRPNPMEHLLPRNIPPVDAEVLLMAGLQLLPHLSDALFLELAGHSFLDPEDADDNDTEHQLLSL